MAADRAAAIAAAEAAISEADWQRLADWLCRVLRAHYLRQQGAAQERDGARTPSGDDVRARRSERDEEECCARSTAARGTPIVHE